MATKRKLPEIEPTEDAPKKSKKSWKSVTRAIQYYTQEKYGKALALLFKYEDIEARAMFLLGCMYNKGQGVVEDMEKAASYMVKLVNFPGIRKAEEDLLAMAYYHLGDLYYRGVVFPTDHSRAEKHWRKGASLSKNPETGRHHYGTMKCQSALGMFYSEPKVKKLKKAFYWHKRAIESGCIVSEAALGVMYMCGMGTEVDLQLAYNHLTNAAVMENVYARGYLAAYYYKRQMYHRTVCLGRELDALKDYEQIAERSDCNIESIKQGVAVGIFHLAMCLQYGYAVEQDISYSKKLIKKALGISTDVTYDLHINAIFGTL